MKLRYDRRIFLLAVAAGFPGILASILLLWAGEYSRQTIVTAGIVLVAAWAVAASSLRHRIVFPLQTMANLLEALR
ncbi:MAG: PAS domain-containing sensor histidine kinase, partial [Vicinamibacterales bacterium]